MNRTIISIEVQDNGGKDGNPLLLLVTLVKIYSHWLPTELLVKNSPL